MAAEAEEKKKQAGPAALQLSRPQPMEAVSNKQQRCVCVCQRLSTVWVAGTTHHTGLAAAALPAASQQLPSSYPAAAPRLAAPCSGSGDPFPAAALACQTPAMAFFLSLSLPPLPLPLLPPVPLCASRAASSVWHSPSLSFLPPPAVPWVYRLPAIRHLWRGGPESSTRSLAFVSPFSQDSELAQRPSLSSPMNRFSPPSQSIPNATTRGGSKGKEFTPPPPTHAHPSRHRPAPSPTYGRDHQQRASDAKESSGTTIDFMHREPCTTLLSPLVAK